MKEDAGKQDRVVAEGDGSPEVNALTPGFRRRGRRVFDAHEWQLLADRLNLSEREFQILQHVFDGHSESAISEAIGVSRHTVHVYLRRLYRKLDLGNRTELIVHTFGVFISSKLDRRAGGAERLSRPAEGCRLIG